MVCRDALLPPTLPVLLGDILAHQLNSPATSTEDFPVLYLTD